MRDVVSPVRSSLEAPVVGSVLERQFYVLDERGGE